jgi:lysophospholipid acyltransferase (LPLAT)-like uncharacterized protein
MRLTQSRNYTPNMKFLPRQFISHYVTPRLLAYGGKALLKILKLTCRIEVEGFDRFRSEAQKGKCILMLWHNRLMMVAPIFQKATPELIYTAFISQSRDGEALAIFTNSYKNGRTIRVRHQAKQGALKEMIDRLKNSNEVMLVTPDGPRGPRYVLKPGIAMAAQETSATIFPFSWMADKYWQLKSWDGMMIPKPFSRITAKIGNPITLSKESSLEENRLILENALK